ncbi:MAG: YeeE/YedE family protein [Mesorhizobium sp.]
MTDFTPFQSLLGGALIGLSAVLLMAFHGRIAGMTGILTGIIPPLSPDWQWRAAFLAGAIMAPLLFMAFGGRIAFSVPVSTLALVGGGFLVGLGVHFGAGCPSGHGICGIARLSPRSIVAVATFMVTAFATVFIVRHVFGVT